MFLSFFSVNRMICVKNMVYKIADFYFEFPGADKALTDYCAEYACDATKADAAIIVTEEDVEAEKELFILNTPEAEAKAEKLRNQHIVLAAYRKICAYVLQHDAFLMHGVALEYDGNGYIFTAKSGTGKTTHVLQWKKRFGEENVTIVNGDKPIIRFIDGKVYAYGTPWNGKEHFGTTGRTEVKGLCFVDRGEENLIKPISVTEAVTRLFSQIMLHDSTDLARQLELVDMFFEKVPVYNLKCNISTEAAEVAYRGMKK